MKKLYVVLFFVSLFFLPFCVSAKEVTVNLFYGQECPHCESEQQYLAKLKKQYGDNVRIKKYEVWHNKSNSDLLAKVRKKLNNDDRGVPYTVIGTTDMTGFNDNIASDIKKLVQENMKSPDIDAVSYIVNDKPIKKVKKSEDTHVSIPWLGSVDAKSVSLPLISIIIGLVDGFNPCAMWVLLLLISMLLTMKDKKRKWILGIVFLVTSAVVYLFFMVAWLQIAVSAMQQVLLRIVIAIIAMVAAIINLRSYFKEKDNPNGCVVTDDTKRQKIFKKIKKFTTEKSFILAILGVITLAFTVNLVELACSAGLPLLFTSVLAMNDLSGMQYAFYMFIYIFFFLIDDLIVFIIAMKTLEVTGISTKYNKYSHLIGGLIMLLIASLLILKPEWIMFNF